MSSARLRILDLCCGEGLASIGYKTVWPHAEITGVDVVDMSSSYPFSFVLGDAFALTYQDIEGFDFIHISPPCQRYSKVTPARYRDSHPHLIPNALRLGYASGKPFVVENVPGSTQWLRPNCVLTAGGKVRYFHSNFYIASYEWPDVISIMTSRYSRKQDILSSWGIPDEYQATMKGIRQGIPPIMTAHIARCFEWVH